MRGHDESAESAERGLFLEMVGILERYDPVIGSHLAHSGRNALYTSNRIQNDFLQALNNVALEKIRLRVNGQAVAVMADETSDCGHHEQMAVVIRFFDEIKNEAVEYYVAIKRVTVVDAKNIFSTLDAVIANLKIEWSSVTSVCFDGAATMSGHESGVQQRCKEKNPRILYVHCYAHCLNLVLVDACASRTENPLIFDFLGTIQFVFTFIEGSPGRHAVFENILKEVGGLRAPSLKSLSTTRWACRAEAVSSVKRNYSVIVQAIEEVVNTTKHTEVRSKGKGLLYQLKSFEFIFALHVMQPILAMVLKVSKYLQYENLSLLVAMAQVRELKAALVDMRTRPENFDEIFEEVEAMSGQLCIEIPAVKRRKVSSRLDANPDTQYIHLNKSSELRVTCFNPLIDTLVSGIDRRFQQDTVLLIDSMGKLLCLEIDNYHLSYLASHFNLSKEELQAEIRLLRAVSSNSNSESDPIPKGHQNVAVWIKWMKKTGRGPSFPEFLKSLKLFSTFPVTSCSCERAFSKLTIVKNKLRTTMSQERLESMMLLFIEQELAKSLDLDEVIDEFKRMIPTARRMVL